VFELLLRLKGNFIWPAMWGSAFYDDDPFNGPLADEMGIVVGTSHHEPMGRAHAEWKRYGNGEWNFGSNATVLKQFWAGGMERMKEWEKVFELLLRLKGNFIWPAMWGSAFYDDDPFNGPLADEMGIVVGTSHHEPMGRAHAEWKRPLADEMGIVVGTSHHEPMGRAHAEWKRYGNGEWNFGSNATVLKQFWAGGMERMKEWEKVVTIG
ncbi:Glycosyl hydrolase family 115, partial [Popillia japonica]